jgi:CubicO group peptidase (beta-lactamase class C family)
MKTSLALIVSVLTITGLLVGQDSRSAQVDQLLAQWNGSDTPGAAVAVAREGEVLHIGTYGVRDVGTGEPITRDTAFYIASTSKQFTAACIAHLAQSGELSLDDDVRKYVPELPDYGDTITVRHLLTHRSGLRDFLELMIFAGWDMDAEHDEQRALALICRQKELNFRPGSDFGYSNSGYFLLSEIVHRVSGSSLREYAEEKVFAPLGMNHSAFKDDPDQVIESGGGARADPFGVPGAAYGVCSGGFWWAVHHPRRPAEVAGELLHR